MSKSEKIKDATFPGAEESIETIKDIYRWESYPVMVLTKITGSEIKFGFIMAGLPTVIRLSNLLRMKEVLDFPETKSIPYVEYDSIEEMVNDGWKLSPVQP
jgi:hypothetical protein